MENENQNQIDLDTILFENAKNPEAAGEVEEGEVEQKDGEEKQSINTLGCFTHFGFCLRSGDADMNNM